jgi:hypothetical protein
VFVQANLSLSFSRSLNYRLAALPTCIQPPTAGRRFGAGVVLYDGSATIDFGSALFAIPVRRLWETE